MLKRLTNRHKLEYPTFSFGHIPGGAVLILTTAPSVNKICKLRWRAHVYVGGEYKCLMSDSHSSSGLSDLLLIVNIYFGYMNCFIYKNIEFVI